MKNKRKFKSALQKHDFLKLLLFFFYQYTLWKSEPFYKKNGQKSGRLGSMVHKLVLNWKSCRILCHTRSHHDVGLYNRIGLCTFGLVQVISVFRYLVYKNEARLNGETHVRFWCWHLYDLIKTVCAVGAGLMKFLDKSLKSPLRFLFWLIITGGWVESSWQSASFER